MVSITVIVPRLVQDSRAQRGGYPHGTARCAPSQYAPLSGSVGPWGRSTGFASEQIISDPRLDRKDGMIEICQSIKCVVLSTLQ